MLMVMGQKEDVRAQLIEKAREQGAISYDDILGLLPEAERDVALLDDIMDELMDAGVAVVPGAHPGEDLLSDFLPLAEDGVDVAPDEESLALLDSDLTNDAGYQQALDTDDVVGL